MHKYGRVGWEIALDGSLKACVESWLKLLDSTSPPRQAEEGGRVWTED
jgi:hypothetical protein